MAYIWRIIWGILILIYPNLIYGYLNIFISHKEVIKIMGKFFNKIFLFMMVKTWFCVKLFPGLEADLFYVHEGAINNFAIQFRVPLPADHYDVEFSWESLTSYPVSGVKSKSFHKFHFLKCNYMCM